MASNLYITNTSRGILFGGVVCLNIQSLAVMKGSLALILFSKDIDAITHSICNIWVMREYGVVESWTK